MSGTSLAILTSIVCGLFLGAVLYIARLFHVEALVGIFLATIVTFLISDFTSKFVIRGGRGIVQVPMLQGVLAVRKATAFLALFIIVPVVAILVDFFVQQLTAVIEMVQLGFIFDLAIGLVLSLLLYLDLELKFYPG